MPGIAPYITAKAGTNAFARIVHEEVRNFGVTAMGKFSGFGCVEGYD
jgi:hypothetical protein